MPGITPAEARVKPSILQRLTAEFVGTFTLIFIGVGAICVNQMTGGGSGLLGVAVAHGLAIAIMATAVGHISGGQFNPAVSAALWVTKRMDTVETLLYWLAQLAGAAAAAFLVTLLVPEEVWRAVQLGTPGLTKDFTLASGMIMEGVMTFLLVFVVFATAVDERGALGKIAGFAIGLTVTMDILFAGPFTGAAMNPARAFGPALAGKYWAAQGVYWVGPLFGGIVAGWLYDALYLKKKEG
jgi:aquaporin Z